MQTHTVKSYDEDLKQLRSLIAQMGGIAENQILGAINALQKRDAETAQYIVATDQSLDALEVEVESQTVRVIALRAPMADDLREVISALKLSALLERIGDYSKNIAKRTTVLAQSSPIEPMVVVTEMGRLVARMMSAVMNAYTSRDYEAAELIWVHDRDVDNFYNSIFRSLLTYMMENPQHITMSTHLLFIAKNLERIGDHITNVAEIIYFNATGRPLPDERPKGDTTAYVFNPTPGT